MGEGGGEGEGEGEGGNAVFQNLIPMKGYFSRKLDVLQTCENILLLFSIPSSLRVLFHHCKPNIE